MCVERMALTFRSPEDQTTCGSSFGWKVNRIDQFGWTACRAFLDLGMTLANFRPIG